MHSQRAACGRDKTIVVRSADRRGPVSKQTLSLLYSQHRPLRSLQVNRCASTLAGTRLYGCENEQTNRRHSYPRDTYSLNVTPCNTPFYHIYVARLSRSVDIRPQGIASNVKLHWFRSSCAVQGTALELGSVACPLTNALYNILCVLIPRRVENKRTMIPSAPVIHYSDISLSQLSAFKRGRSSFRARTTEDSTLFLGLATGGSFA